VLLAASFKDSHLDVLPFDVALAVSSSLE